MRAAQILIILFSVISGFSFTQNIDKLKYFQLNYDTISFYLNEDGEITIKSKAKYYRHAQIDKISFNYINKVEDFYINNQKAYQCLYIQGYLNNEVKCFYQNGQIKYQGYYKNSLKDSTWTFFYKNGNKEKTVLYKCDNYYLKEFYKKNGDSIFLNGNGKYKGLIISGFKQTTEYEISGNIKNGKFDGKWNLTGNNSSAVEYFENGNFIKGSSYGLIYTTDPKITLTGFNLHENVDIFKFRATPDTDENKFLFAQMLKYKGSNNLNKIFTEELNNHLISINKENSLKSYWCFIQFKVTKENEIENIIVYSNDNFVSNNIQEFIENLKGFEAPKPNENAVDCAIYLSLFCENGKINIPEYSFNSGINLMNLIPNN